MFDLQIEADIQAAVGALDAVRVDQLPFALSLALNRIAQAAKKDVTAEIATKYRNRSGSLAFLMQGVRMDAATKVNPTATVYDADWFMAYQEEGGRKQASGNKWERIRAAAIDGVRVPPSVTALLAQHGSGYFINQFRSSGDWFLGHRYLNGGAEGEDRDRFGDRHGNRGFSVVMLLEKAVDVKPTFGMRETVEKTVETGFAAAFRDAAEQAMATAR
ncbi:MAG: hypothetical protein P4L40_03710 [Terracidiphilus sp.]|nr:hypothetical protein [Terracidiphilus sp.]